MGRLLVSGLRAKVQALTRVFVLCPWARFFTCSASRYTGDICYFRNSFSSLFCLGSY